MMAHVDLVTFASGLLSGLLLWAGLCVFIGIREARKGGE